MIHLGLATVYLIINIYYLFAHSLTFEQRVHASFTSFLMLYSLARHKISVSDLPIFFIIHFCLYAIDGGRQQPFWMSIYVCHLVVFKIIKLAETKIYTMSAELHRVLPSWEYEFLYTNEAPPRLSLTTQEQRNTNNLLHDYVKTRIKEEVPIYMTPEERHIWKVSDNNSALVNRTDRCVLSWCLICAMLFTYGLWWLRLINGFRYYFIIDMVMFLSLSCSWKIQLFVYHTAFACATFYLQHSDFNPSIQHNDVVVHQHY